MSQLRVLLTGAAGRIGSCLWPVFRARYTVRAFDRLPIAAVPDALVVNLTDAAAVRQACTDIDVVVHLAASPGDRPTFVEEVVPNNVVGMYNLLEAAVQQRVRRVVFASSVQTVGGVPADAVITPQTPVQPQGPYGATKVFGEALGRYYHDRYGLEFVALRLGGFIPYNAPVRNRPGIENIWLSPRDAADIFCRAVETPKLGYAIIFATSQPTRERFSLREARDLLGYAPHDTWARSSGQPG